MLCAFKLADRGLTCAGANWPPLLRIWLLLQWTLQSSLTFMLSGTRILRAFLIIGCGLSSSSLKECLLGSKFCWLETLDIAMSEGSMSNIPIASGPLPVGVSRGGQEDEDEDEGDSQDSFILVWLPGITRMRNMYHMLFIKLHLKWNWFSCQTNST